MKPRAILPALFILMVFMAVYLTTTPRKEIGLKRFYEITKADPLFYDPSIELDKFDNAVTDLSISEKNFRNTYQKYLETKDEKIFSRDWELFPIDFLKELSTTIKKTDKFLKEPTFFKASGLLQAYKRSTTSYKKNAELQLMAISNLIKANPSILKRKIHFLGSATSLEVVKSDLELILENTAALETEIAAREKCLYSEECAETINNPPEKEFVQTLDETNQALLSVDLLRPPYGYGKILGPYFLKSGCWGWEQDKIGKLEPKIQAFYLFEKNGKITPKLATEIFYIDYKALEASWKTAELFLERHVRFQEQSATNDYRCPDLTYLPRLYAAAYHRTILWGLPYLIERVASTLEFLTLDQKLLKTSSDNLYILSSRTDYSLLFLPYAKTVWRIEKTPQYFIKENIPLDRGFETHRGLLAKGMSDENLKAMALEAIPQTEIMKAALEKENKYFFPFGK